MIRPNEAPTDTLARLLEQSQGVLSVIASTYDEQNKEHAVPAQHLQASIWTVENLLEEMGTAFDKLVAEQASEREERQERCHHRDNGRGFCVDCGKVIPGGYGG